LVSFPGLHRANGSRYEELIVRYARIESAADEATAQI